MFFYDKTLFIGSNGAVSKEFMKHFTNTTTISIRNYKDCLIAQQTMLSCSNIFLGQRMKNMADLKLLKNIIDILNKNNFKSRRILHRR